MKSIMILGANEAVVPLIRAARSLHIKTVAASIPGDYPGFSEADEACLVDITSPDEVLAEAKKRGIDGIATCCMDIGLKAQGRVCSELSLPGPSAMTAALSTDKYLMKQAFTESGVSTPPFYPVFGEKDLPEAASRFHYPVILKAVDQMGSRGIYKCNSYEEVLENYPKCLSFTKAPYCLMEQFVEGIAFGVEGMVSGGEILYSLANRTITYEGFTPTPIGHYYPAPELEAVGNSIREETEKIIRALKIKDAPFNCDFILSGSDVLCLEATARAGANCLPELVGTCFGVNYYEQIVRLAMGMELSGAFRETGTEKACLSFALFSGKSGTVTHFDPGSLTNADLVDLEAHVRCGDSVRAYTNGRDYLGHLFITGRSAEHCRELLRAALDEIALEVDHIPQCRFSDSAFT